MIEIEVDPHHVTIENFRVPRPNGVSVTAWMAYWEEHIRGTFSDGYERCCYDHEIIE